MREFSGSLLTITEGVRDIASISNGDTSYTTLLNHGRHISYPKPYGFGEDTMMMIVASNPEQSDCGCTANGSSVWGKRGTLGLQHIVICFDEIKHMFQIDLILPLKNQGSGVDGFTTFSIKRDGSVNGRNHQMSILKGACFINTLGLADQQIFARSTSTGGDMDDRIGFPEAQNYIAKHIGSLGLYLSALAMRLKEHTH